MAGVEPKGAMDFGVMPGNARVKQSRLDQPVTQGSAVHSKRVFSRPTVGFSGCIDSSGLECRRPEGVGGQCGQPKDCGWVAHTLLACNTSIVGPMESFKIFTGPYSVGLRSA